MVIMRMSVVIVLLSAASVVSAALATTHGQPQAFRPGQRAPIMSARMLPSSRGRSGAAVMGPSAISVMTAFDWIGTVSFAFSGTLLAVEYNMTLTGAALLGVTTSVGGGTIRDVLMGVGRVFWLVDIRYFVACLTTSLVTLLLWPTVARRTGMCDDSAWPLVLSDAIGLGAFAVLGARKALALSLPPGGSVLCGLLTACGGGVVRDVLCRRPPRIFHTSQTAYGTPALIGAALYVALRVIGGPALEATALTLGFLCVFGLRLVAHVLSISPPGARSLRPAAW